MERRVELTLLMDFYGPLLTEHRRKVLQMYLDEDMALQEIADALGISRQGVHEAVKTAAAQLTRYEETLGIVRRYQGIRREVAVCSKALGRVHPDARSEVPLQEARNALDRIDRIER